MIEGMWTKTTMLNAGVGPSHAERGIARRKCRSVTSPASCTRPEPLGKRQHAPHDLGM